jgi:hypothetical protein
VVVVAPSHRLDHGRPHVTGQQRQHVTTTHVTTQRAGLSGELLVELVDPDRAPLEARPGVVVGVGGVDRTDETGRQAALGLEASERLERAGGDHATEVEEHGTDGHRQMVARGGFAAPPLSAA